MKKILLASVIGSALAAMLPATAHAATYGDISSDITNVQLWMGNLNLMTFEAPGTFTELRFNGWAMDTDDDGFIDQSNAHLTGLINFTISGLDFRLDFNLSNGEYVQGSGITFKGGGVQVDVLTPTSGWLPYDTIDASQTNLGFLADQSGHWSKVYPDQTTAGIVRNLLPGLWDGAPGSAGFDRGVGAFSLLAEKVGFYMEGTVWASDLENNRLQFGPPEVPVPAAAWLFGSALAGLGGVQWQRRRASSR
jgi:hypothetical protein